MKKNEIIKELKEALKNSEIGKQKEGSIYGYSYAYGMLTQSIKSIILMFED